MCSLYQVSNPRPSGFRDSNHYICRLKGRRTETDIRTVYSTSWEHIDHKRTCAVLSWTVASNCGLAQVVVAAPLSYCAFNGFIRLLSFLTVLKIKLLHCTGNKVTKAALKHNRLSQCFWIQKDLHISRSVCQYSPAEPLRLGWELAVECATVPSAERAELSLLAVSISLAVSAFV
jgi:hypothetical protein